MSGLKGDNITAASEAMPWYQVPTLLEHLATVPLAATREAAPYRMAVQWVHRPNSSFRGYAGRIASGTVRPRDVVSVLHSGHPPRLQRNVPFHCDPPHPHT